MDRFVKLEIFDESGKKVLRTFNVHYIRHVDEGSGRMLLNGARKPVVVDHDSMTALVQAISCDIDAMSERISYLQAKADSRTLPVNATLVISDRTGGELSSAIRELADAMRVPWWKRLFGRNG